MDRPSSPRTFSEPEPSRMKDRDAFETALRLKALLWSCAGAVIGFIVGAFVAMEHGGPGSILYPFLGMLVGGGFVYFGARFITGAAGSAGGILYNPSGSSVPYERQHSYAASLAARGEYQDALTAYELTVAEHPGEPEPYLRIARLLRDEMDRPEEAARWFRRARTETVLPPGREILVSRELIELYRSHLGKPRKAAPELARLAQRYADTPDGEWARRELAEVKALIRAEHERVAPGGSGPADDAPGASGGEPLPGAPEGSADGDGGTGRTAGPPHGEPPGP